MHWIRHATVDILVTITIIIAVMAHVEWLEWVVIGYSILILISKVAIIAMNTMQTLLRGRISEVPEWASHMLYAINVIALIVFGWYLIATIWLVIWYFSYITYKRVKITKTAVAA
jgi:hypothetical protein